jgi:hypothetical protein
VGFCGVFEQHSGFGFFLLTEYRPRQPNRHAARMQAVGCRKIIRDNLRFRGWWVEGKYGSGEENPDAWNYSSSPQRYPTRTTVQAMVG